MPLACPYMVGERRLRAHRCVKCSDTVSSFRRLFHCVRHIVLLGLIRFDDRGPKGHCPRRGHRPPPPERMYPGIASL
ncbi:hypothetical protein CEXT_245151 [Caerostris extrusa]|uniref:Uncharacterized protein n=1 Tax=Caerostris extrusa TaxID=172846 RepID=A0AAV4XGU5_CAEEX|nr:hypothetical protein CEXT_245151 [Caerostris extrusa]